MGHQTVGFDYGGHHYVFKGTYDSGGGGWDEPPWVELDWEVVTRDGVVLNDQEVEALQDDGQWLAAVELAWDEDSMNDEIEDYVAYWSTR